MLERICPVIQLRSKTLGVASALALGATTVAVVAGGPAVASTCNYPNSVITTTTASSPSTVVYGRSAPLSATVASGSGTPTGNVTFRIATTSRSKTAALSSGSASVLLGRFLPAQTTYKFTADYAASCNWMASSDSGSFKVVKAGTTTTALVPNITSGDTLNVNVKVASNTRGRPHGRVRIALWHRGQRHRFTYAHLRRGTVSVAFGNVKRPGRWVAIVTYRGAHNFLRSHTHQRFWVAR